MLIRDDSEFREAQTRLTDLRDQSRRIRDERNEYRGISLEKYGKVLAALGFEDHPITPSSFLREHPT